MAQEIERKFLVRDDAWRALGEPFLICQGYLVNTRERIVRVRIAGRRAWITVKGPSLGLSRPEFEYEIPSADACEMLDTLCPPPVMEKRRTRIAHAGLVWEVDEFLGENAGLVVAEVELSFVEQTVEVPPWIGEEVTGDARYYNANLLKNPYSHWKQTV